MLNDLIYLLTMQFIFSGPDSAILCPETSIKLVKLIWYRAHNNKGKHNDIKTLMAAGMSTCIHKVRQFEMQTQAVSLI